MLSRSDSLTVTAGRRRVVLVDLYWSRDKDPRIPLGHASLRAALARETGVEVVPVVEAVNLVAVEPEALVARLMGSVAGWSAGDVDIAFGVYVWADGLVRATLTGLRRAGFGGRIVLGGPQISYAGPGLEALYPEADAFVRGYGEAALCALAREAGRPDVVGVHYAGATDVVAQAAVDLSALPSPWIDRVIPIAGQRFVRWESQRGCPYRCGFCQHREAGARLRRRALSCERVAAEIDLFCASGVDDIAVLDPIFNAGDEAIAILERFAARGFRGRLSLQCRAESLGVELLDVAARLDVRLELGLQTIHRAEMEAIGRNNHMAKVDGALARIRERGIAHEVSIIFGLPQQTLPSFIETVAWCLERAVPVIKAFPLLLLRGTPLERDAARWGLACSGGDMPMVVRSSTFDEREWDSMARLSEALKATEGRHPPIDELLVLAEACEPQLGRWTSAAVGA